MSLPNPPTPTSPPSPNNLTSSQTTAVIDLSALLQTALYFGVFDSNGSPLVAPLDSRYQKMPATSQQMVIDAYRGAFASLIQAFNGISTTVSYLKPDMSTGTLTFVNGILTGSS